jgi:nucleoside-diphosphate-sugar epimerase
MSIEIRRAVIFGATGATGKHIARELVARKIPVRAVSRSEASLKVAFGAGIEIFPADLREPGAAARAASGCDMIFHCVGLPYQQFRDHPVLARTTAEVMRETGARGLLVSSYYGYEPILAVPVAEDAPRAPIALKARDRKLQEEILQDAGAAVTLLPDFYGPEADLSLLNIALRAAVARKVANWIGGLDVERQFIYVPDVARPLVDLAMREEAYGERWNIAGTGGITPRRVFEIVEKILGRRVRTRSVGPTTLRLLGVFSTLLLEIAELYPLYASPMVLETRKLRSLIGPYPVTPYEEGLRTTIDWMRGEGAPRM